MSRWGAWRKGARRAREVRSVRGRVPVHTSEWGGAGRGRLLVQIFQSRLYARQLLDYDGLKPAGSDPNATRLNEGQRTVEPAPCAQITDTRSTS